jgi:beta-glucosidase
MKMTSHILVVILTVTCAALATRISDVKVDLLKGYNAVIENSKEVRYYMGRLTYTFQAEEDDSIRVDFVISKEGSKDKLVIVEKVGDVGAVKQKNANDTIKTIYFRTRIDGDPSGNYVATVTADANISGFRGVFQNFLGQIKDDIAVEYQMITGGDGKSFEGSGLKGFGTNDLRVGDDTIIGLRAADGPHGVRWNITPWLDDPDYMYSDWGVSSTCFPTEAAMANTWNPELIQQVGAAIGKEARSKKVYISLGPMSDLVRHPQGGRSFETYGEDPLLCGKMAAAHCRGLQSVGCIACPKHLTCYNKEIGRYQYVSVVHERALRELFLEPFRMCVDEGRCGAIMTAYNQIEIVPFSNFSATQKEDGCMYASANYHLLKEIVRDEWGFDGVFVTDWQASVNTTLPYAYTSTLDLEMPVQQKYGSLVVNVWQNQTNKYPLKDNREELHNKIRRVLYARYWAGEGKFFSKEAQIQTYKGKPYNLNTLRTEHRDLALRVAEQSIVLARNDAVGGKRLLPIDPQKTAKIALVGWCAKEIRLGGGGSSQVNPYYTITPWTGMDLVKGSGITLTEDYAIADYAIVFVGPLGESEDADRPNLDLPATDNELVKKVRAVNPNTIVVYIGGSPSNESEWSKAPAILIAYYPGQEQGKAIAEVILGKVNPSGKLSVTFPRNVSQLTYGFELVNNKIPYTSVDSAHGYFWFDKKTQQEPLFCFGHGLSYTNFR